MTKKTDVSRREFIRLAMAAGFSATAAGALLSLTGCGGEQPSELVVQPSATTAPTAEAVLAGETAVPTDEPVTETATEESIATSTDLAIARGSSPTALVQAAVAALGGIEAFVKPGDDVIIKPNIVAADYSYEYAAYTNPEVVAAVTALCVGAGAGRVRAMDRPSSSTCEQVYARSGIGDAVTAAGGEMEVMSDVKYREVAIPEGRDITSWSVYGDVLDADVFINVPIAKHHRLSKLTLSMKNMMGVIQNRNQFHPNLGQRIADLNSLVRPTLTILDAVNILMANGPRGGNLSDVQQMNTVIASRDFVAAGSYAATFFDQTGADIDALRCAAEMGLGTLDYSSLRVEEIAV
jgi:uncharacterized protein (DUF362 family)